MEDVDKLTKLMKNITRGLGNGREDTSKNKKNKGEIPWKSLIGRREVRRR